MNPTCESDNKKGGTKRPSLNLGQWLKLYFLIFHVEMGLNGVCPRGEWTNTIDVRLSSSTFLFAPCALPVSVIPPWASCPTFRVLRREKLKNLIISRSMCYSPNTSFRGERIYHPSLFFFFLYKKGWETLDAPCWLFPKWRCVLEKLLKLGNCTW